MNQDRYRALPVVMFALLCVILWFASSAGYLAAGLSAALALVIVSLGLFYIRYLRRQYEQMRSSVFARQNTAVRRILQGISIPCLIFDETGSITWNNAAFHSLQPGVKNIASVLSTINLKYPEAHIDHAIAGRRYQIHTIALYTSKQNEGVRRLAFQYWLDSSEAMTYRRLYEDNLPTVCLLRIDNYDELNNDKQTERTIIIAEVEKRITNWVSSIEGIFRRSDRESYIVIFPRKYMEEIEKHKFSLLESVHTIRAGMTSVSLSIAVGLAQTIFESDMFAKDGMELALGRGGDQAVVKRGTKYQFYGAKRPATEKHSKVKSRLFARALRTVMESCHDVLIMGHKLSDMDCIGAALGIARCASYLRKQAHIVVERPNISIDSLLKEMDARDEYARLLISPEDAMERVRRNTMLIVLDTQRPDATVAPALIAKTGTIVVIDHHRRNIQSFENLTLHYLEPYASSVCELVTEIIDYFADNIKPTPFEASALLAGISVDTKNFSFNTGARTFEAASYLRRIGADIAGIRLMFQDNLETYVNRAEIVKRAEMISADIAVSICPDDMPNALLIAAQAADALITIRGIQAAFVIAKMGSGSAISGRSIGSINVQLILENLGGGGHLTIAGAQMGNVTTADAFKKLQETVNIYLKEGVE